MTRVAIVGGGLGGLAAAAFLHQAGVPAVVYEQARELREVGAGIMVAPNAARMIRRLGVLGEFRKRAVQLDTGWEFRRWQDGTVLSAQDLTSESARRYGEHTYTVHRADLLEAVSGAVPPGTVRLGKRLDGFTVSGAGARLSFADGEQAEADVLIGADGIHSVIRAALARRSEDRLRTVLGRISRGTYTPTAAERALGFAAGDTGDDSSPFSCTCGAGISPYHVAGCTAVWTPDDAAELKASGSFAAVAARAAADSRDRLYTDQHGNPMTLTSHVEASLGMRLRRDAPFDHLGAMPRQIPSAQRQAGYSDPDDPDGAHQPFSSGTRQAAALAARQAGIELAGDRQARRAHEQAASSARVALSRPARPAHPDFAETSRDRAARLKSSHDPVQLYDELMPGELPAFTLARR